MDVRLDDTLLRHIGSFLTQPWMELDDGHVGIWPSVDLVNAMTIPHFQAMGDDVTDVTIGSRRAPQFRNATRLWCQEAVSRDCAWPRDTQYHEEGWDVRGHERSLYLCTECLRHAPPLHILSLTTIHLSLHRFGTPWTLPDRLPSTLTTLRLPPGLTGSLPEALKDLLGLQTLGCVIGPEMHIGDTMAVLARLPRLTTLSMHMEVVCEAARVEKDILHGLDQAGFQQLQRVALPFQMDATRTMVGMCKIMDSGKLPSFDMTPMVCMWPLWRHHGELMRRLYLTRGVTRIPTLCPRDPMDGDSTTTWHGMRVFLETLNELEGPLHMDHVVVTTQTPPSFIDTLVSILTRHPKSVIGLLSLLSPSSVVETLVALRDVVTIQTLELVTTHSDSPGSDSIRLNHTRSLWVVPPETTGLVILNPGRGGLGHVVRALRTNGLGSVQVLRYQDSISTPVSCHDVTEFCGVVDVCRDWRQVQKVEFVCLMNNAMVEHIRHALAGTGCIPIGVRTVDDCVPTLLTVKLSSPPGASWPGPGGPCDRGPYGLSALRRVEIHGSQT
jgi:hypothetical protein